MFQNKKGSLHLVFFLVIQYSNLFAQELSPGIFFEYYSEDLEYFINDDNVRIRQAPNLDAPILGILMTEDIVIPIEHSENQMTIEEYGTHYWFKCELPSNPEQNGWVFGQFLDYRLKTLDEPIFIVTIEKQSNFSDFILSVRAVFYREYKNFQMEIGGLENFESIYNALVFPNDDPLAGSKLIFGEVISRGSRFHEYHIELQNIPDSFNENKPFYAEISSNGVRTVQIFGMDTLPSVIPVEEYLYLTNYDDGESGGTEAFWWFQLENSTVPVLFTYSSNPANSWSSFYLYNGFYVKRWDVLHGNNIFNYYGRFKTQF